MGSGFAGLAAAIRLDQAGHRDFVVIERGADVGGTWRDNSYPGATCDVPSHLYSYSFAPNPNWTRSFSPQPEIWRYLRRVAHDSGTLDRHVFDCELTAARWEHGHWTVDTSKGGYTADVLVTAFGVLCEPRRPDIDGIDSFAGQLFHSSGWPADVDLRGRRVAVIGTGASSIQIVPAIAGPVAQLDVYQRSAPWIMPRNDRAYTRLERVLFGRFPALQKIPRVLIYAGREGLAAALCYAPGLLRAAEKVAAAHLRRQVADPSLRARLSPKYRLGCKRLLISNDYYPALARDNVELVTDAIAAIGPSSIRTADGTERPADVIVIATGFQATDSPAADLITGADGRTLGEHWRADGQHAYKGTTTAGFPNCFSLVGPNTGLGHSSMIYMIESQVAYVVSALSAMTDRRLATVEVRGEVEDAYNRDVQRRMKRTVWLSGCHSWYLDARGRNTALWPGFTFRFRRLTRRFDLDAYRTTSG